MPSQHQPGLCSESKNVHTIPGPLSLYTQFIINNWSSGFCKVLTLMVLVANYIMMQKTWKMIKTLAHTYVYSYLRVLSASYPMNTNMIWFRCIWKKSLHLCALDESNLSSGRVKQYCTFDCYSHCKLLGLLYPHYIVFDILLFNLTRALSISDFLTDEIVFFWKQVICNFSGWAHCVGMLTGAVNNLNILASLE